ncbi:MAG TPA: hypothetical protein VH206_24455 [Xanthobacteraceae bacterium]|jgi:hypothetical protein|nr:hypothetical protein [Xanthobacteraceae bacterium]
MDLALVLSALQKFSGPDLTATLTRVEADIRGVDLGKCKSVLAKNGAERETLAAAATLKRVASQVNVAIHALGVLLCLPRILEPGEVIEYVSLGAGNTGRDFDLETNLRVAEFKFIRWRGGPESIRQNSIFKDFFLLAESDTAKRKYLYVLGTEFPLKFLNARRALSSVLSKDERVRTIFRAKFGEEYGVVRDYYLEHNSKVTIADVSDWVPELLAQGLEETA